MRKSIGELLSEYKIDVACEFCKLWQMFYGNLRDALGASVYYRLSGTDLRLEKSVKDVCNDYFLEFPISFRRTFRSLDEIADACHYSFESLYLGRNRPVLDDLLDLAELVWSSLSGLVAMANESHIELRYATATIHDAFVPYLNQLMDDLGFVCAPVDPHWVSLVPKDSRVIEVAGRIPQELSKKCFTYIHRSMEGNIDAKREFLREFGSYLEPKRKMLEGFNKTIGDKIFSMLNNANIRHNNVIPGDKNYKAVIADMSADDLERLYDSTYDLCLTACMLLDSSRATSAISAVEAKF